MKNGIIADPFAEYSVKLWVGFSVIFMNIAKKGLTFSNVRKLTEIYDLVYQKKNIAVIAFGIISVSYAISEREIPIELLSV